MIGTFLQNPTVEGDNAMLPMQVMKILLKLVKDVQSEDPKAMQAWSKCNASYLIHPVQSMLNGHGSSLCNISSKEDMLDVDICLKAFQHRAARLLVQVASQIQQEVIEGKSFESAWNSALIQMGRVSKAHSLFLLLSNFSHGIKDESNSMLGPNEVQILNDLALLFGLYWIEKDDGEFLADGYFSDKHINWARSCVLIMLDKIRPNAVGLVDANDFSDYRLKSCIGRYDGNVYEAILEAAKKDPLNSTEPGPGYEEHLKSLIVDGIGSFAGTASRL